MQHPEILPRSSLRSRTHPAAAAPRGNTVFPSQQDMT